METDRQMAPEFPDQTAAALADSKPAVSFAILFVMARSSLTVVGGSAVPALHARLREAAARVLHKSESSTCGVAQLI